MAGDLHLCPSCAAHLRVDARLHLMRCNNCNGELVYINEGGVRGLALLPACEGVIPYSHPAQRHVPIDGRALLECRRTLVMLDTRRKHRFWTRMFFGTVAVLMAVLVAGIAGMDYMVKGHGENADSAAFMLLTAIATLPIFAYVALYFQGRARLLKEAAERWRA